MKDDYRDVDEIMRRYVKATNGDVEKDFAKLDFSKYPEKPHKAKKKMPFYAWASIAMACIVVLTLAISLPLTMGGKTPSEPNIYYLEIETLNKEELSSLLEIEETFNSDIYLPKTEYIDFSAWYLISNESIDAGTLIDMAIFDDRINEINGYILFENIEIDSLSKFDEMQNSYNWNNIVVRYNYKIDPVLFTCEYNIMFTANGLKHYYTITTVSEMEIGQLLDWVF